MKIPQRRKSEYNEKVLDLRRVTRVVAGGKRFRFRATLVMGDGKGKVGVGVSKGADVAEAIGKARVNTLKRMIRVPLNGRTIPHEVDAKYSAAKVFIKPAIEGHGLRAGGAVRAVLLLAGVKDASAKILGRTTNKLTNALATVEALRQLREKAGNSPEKGNEKSNQNDDKDISKEKNANSPITTEA